MVELMVSMSLMVVGMLGIFAVLSQSLGLNRVVANQYVAVNLAAEGIEVTKNILDANFVNGREWNAGFIDGNYGVQFNSTALDASYANMPLRFNINTGMYNYDVSGTETNFRRTVSIRSFDNTGDTFTDEIKVVSRVIWKDRGGIDFEVELEDRFRNWRASP